MSASLGSAPPSRKRRAAGGSSSDVVPGTPGSSSQTGTPTQSPARTQPKLDISYILRQADKHVNVKFHYKGELYKFVQKSSVSDKLGEVFKAMQTEGLIKYHGREMYEPGGAPGVKVANPDYQYYPGYGNHKTEGVETMPAARCVSCTFARLAEYASEYIDAFHFLAQPEQLGDPMITYNTMDEYIAFINTVPEPLDEEEEKEAADPTWRAQVNARLARMETKLKLPPLDNTAS